MSTERPAVFPSPAPSPARPGGPPRGPGRRPAPWTVEDQLRERERRTRVRAALLERLPPPDAGTLDDLGSFRIDLWPPQPAPRPRGAARGPSAAGPVWTGAALLDLIREFAADRGPDFSKQEFIRWARITSGTVNRHCGDWRSTRVAAGLPAEPATEDSALRTLHALLKTLHLNRHRTRPLTAEQLARAAHLSRGPIGSFGGMKQVRNLYRLWVAMHPQAAETP
ncbi:hypothetical protein [Alienimonas californiensis]|uniref:Uncharacterized protein n=1 Tax=Alienimonas californiensis TaxID=2527989 RepID=A0A517P4Z5_9PLAN|nr:hypothetical protein [Alienimonas californiensis]QDT14426.1 hypothetical protein CA12_04990 [Alienimonas californiensis]